MESVALPEAKNIENEVGSLKVETSIADGKITITRSLSLSLQLITPALYPQYYLLMSEWYESAKSPLLFRQL